MLEDEFMDFTHFPDLIGSSMQFGNSAETEDSALDENGLIELPLLPLRGLILFPQMVTPLFVGREKSLAAVRAASANEENLIVVSQRDHDVEEPNEDGLYPIGTEVNIGKLIKLPDSSNSVLCQGKRRVQIVEFVQMEPYVRVKVRPIIANETFEETTEPLMRAVLDMFEKVVELSRRIPDEAYTYAMNIDNPGQLADFVGGALEIPVNVKQTLLESLNPHERLQSVSTMLGREVDVLETENRIHARVQKEIDSSQREHFLREQMRAIQGELGEDDIFTQELNELRTTLEALKLPEEVRTKTEKELARLAGMPPMSPEMGIIRNYLDWIADLPWTAQSDSEIDVAKAASVLDEDHFGLERVKDRILEYIAVRKIAADTMRTPILCFVGPPGVGKTSLGRSIATALNREFVRMSLGGVRDEAEIRGHRRTYIGAMPGRILQSLRRVGTNNPLMMLDEIDKLGNDFRGDPASALLEVLDPEQNSTFRDHYLDLDFDLSKILFITTCNTLSTVPPALRDRMEIIEFSSYLEEEKIDICKQFVIPRQLKEHGLSEYKITFDNSALQTIIKRYTNEAGVRNLDREIATVCRKIARRVAEGRKFPIRLRAPQIKSLLGPPTYPDEVARNEAEVGVATGVAWTAVGGVTLQIEVSLMPGKGNLVLTGTLGDVMKESARAALTYTRSQSETLGIAPERFESTDIHVHVPEGGTPKDGPSAGVPITIALISAFTNRPIRSDIGMTGEITLRGRVLGVGGIREKALAARRLGISTFAMPKRNHADLHNIPKRLRQDLTFIELDKIDELIETVLLPAVK